MNNNQRIRILLIQDSKAQANLIEQIFNINEYSVTTILDGKEALDFLLKNDYEIDVVLTDFHLPTLNGLELIEQTNKAEKKIAYIFLTLEKHVDTIVQVMKSGAMDYITKSAKIHEELPTKVLKAHELHQALLAKLRFEKELLKIDIKFQKIFDESNDCIVIHSPDGQIVSVNRKAEEIFGYTREEFIKLKIREFDKKKVIFNSREILEMFEKQGNIKYEIPLYKKDGTFFIGDISASRTVFDDETLIIQVIRDITERKRTLEALQTSEQMLREANSAKDKMFSIIGHDLRGPMGAIKQLFDLIVDKPEILDGNLLTMIRETIGSTYTLLENLLLWASNQRGNVHFDAQNIKMQDIVNENFSLLSSNARNKSVELKSEIGSSVVVFGDKNMITTIIRNLVSNAIKFTPEDGRIILSAKAIDDKFEICVEDTGIGISEEDIALIFADNKYFTTYGTNNEKGSGLGLNLCKDFVERNGGKIWIESEVGKGSKFKFTLPKAK